MPSAPSVVAQQPVTTPPLSAFQPVRAQTAGGGGAGGGRKKTKKAVSWDEQARSAANAAAVALGFPGAASGSESGYS